MPENSLEARLREVETINVILKASIKTIHQDITDCKELFSKFVAGTTQVAELEGKVRVIESLTLRLDNLGILVNNLNRDIVSIRARHDVCVLGKGEEGNILKTLEEKVINIEKANIETALTLNNIVASRGKVDSVVRSWVERAGWLLILVFLYLMLSHSVEISNMAASQNPIKSTVSKIVK